MSHYLIRKLLSVPLLLLVASWLIYLLPYAAGLDSANAVLRARIGERTLSDVQRTEFETKLGLNLSLPGRYWLWLRQVLQGDWGNSLVKRKPVMELLWQHLHVTVVLAATAIVAAFVMALGLGILAAHYAGRWQDTLITSLSQVGVAVPDYWLAPLFILLFALLLGWLPSSGWRGLEYAILPVLTLAVHPLAYFVSQVRAALLDVLAQDYIRAAKAKGLRPSAVLLKHALRNALIPVTTLATSWFTGLLGGSVIVEVIFAVPGMGRLLYEAALAADVPLLQGSLLLLTLLAVLLTTLTDLLYVVINPALRLGNAS
jgi:peptide/nickel transport system permease protein